MVKRAGTIIALTMLLTLYAWTPVQARTYYYLAEKSLLSYVATCQGNNILGVLLCLSSLKTLSYSRLLHAKYRSGT